ncbi:hypothetical protein B0T17DRAFT_619723 [Bombardia bombarda]|uniref:Uncharacterized protein n=1 Tax=Bombardia bombarda TaxID=252184 RepID=A0AA40BV55_9PEZI|nr:hypothetical protein B0T17DRAFT_619723 [Bombardia bombarda]
MHRTPSVASSIVSARSVTPTGWSEYVLRKKYRDPLKLKESLNYIFGSDQYKLKLTALPQQIKGDRWILSLSRPMLVGELEEIEKDSTQHY